MDREFDPPALDSILKFSGNDNEDGLEIERHARKGYWQRLLAHYVEKISRRMVKPIDIFCDLADQLILFFSFALQQSYCQRQRRKRRIELLSCRDDSSVLGSAPFVKFRGFMKNDQDPQRAVVARS